MLDEIQIFRENRLKNSCHVFLESRRYYGFREEFIVDIRIVYRAEIGKQLFGRGGDYVGPGEVVLAWTDNKDDPQYELSHQSLSYLENVRDAKGRKLVIHKLPIPDHPICITKEDLDGYTFEEGEDMREVGERLAASYVNFYFSNDAIILPVFGGENKESDERAVQLMQQWNPDRKVIPVFARDILTGGGNIHCITQQIPR